MLRVGQQLWGLKKIRLLGAAASLISKTTLLPSVLSHLEVMEVRASWNEMKQVLAESFHCLPSSFA